MTYCPTGTRNAPNPRTCTILRLLCLVLLLCNGCARKEDDKERIAFTSDWTGNCEIYIVDPQGQIFQQITNHESADLEPSLDPEGWIAFSSNRDGDYEVFRMDPEGAVSQLTFNLSTDRQPEWSPDGREILFVRYSFWGGYDIYRMDRDGSNQTNLTNSPEDESGPKWSPDGRQIVFSKTIGSNSEIFVMNRDGSGLLQLTDRTAADFSPAWSPDGSTIAFCSESNPGSWHYQIFTMHVDGTGITQVTTGDDDRDPVWSPNGKRIAVVKYDFNGTQIVIIRPDGIKTSDLTQVCGYNTSPDWKLIRVRRGNGTRLVAWDRN